MNYFKAAEQVLSSVSTLEKALENLQRRKARLIDSGRPNEPGAIDYGKPFVDSHFANDVLSDMLEFQECVKNIAETEAALAEIKGIIDQLEGEYKKILQLWYVEKLKKERVMEQMYIDSTSTLYNLRNRAVTEFALLYFGASALPSV